MGIAMFTVSSLFAPLQGFIGWFMPASPQAHDKHAQAKPAQASPRANANTKTQIQHGSTERMRASGRPSCAHRPLRVLRVVEANHVPASAGRMVISGRMADVCAELDRLAALEATRH